MTSRSYLRNPAAVCAALLLLFVAGTSLSASGQTVHRFTIHFDTDKDALSEQAQHTIDSVVELLTNIPEAYKINISGHTDNVGDANYNMALSKRRTAQAKRHLLKHGFSADKLTQDWRGLHDPSKENATETGRSVNRRVEIDIAINEINVAKSLGVEVETKEVRFDASKGTSFTHSSGSEVTIPAYAFVDARGNPIVGDVDVEYKEFRDPLDFVVSGIPMSQVNGNPDKHFSSAGMFEFRAYKDGEELQINNNSAVDVNFAMVDPTMPNLNFWQLEENGEWASQTQVTDEHGTNVVDNGLDVHAGAFDCTMDECKGRVFAIEKGLELTQAGQQINGMELLQTFCNTDPDSIEGNTLTNSFYVHSHKKKKRYQTFVIDGHHIKGHPMKKLWGAIWQLEGYPQDTLPGSLKGSRWTECNVGYNDTSGVFTLWLSNQFQRIAVPARFKGFKHSKISKRNHERYGRMSFQQYTVSRKSWDKRYARLMANEKRKAINNEIYTCDSKLTCFWEYSKFYMPGSELAMSRGEWLTYFNDHLILMRDRYENMNANPDEKLAACQKWVEQVRQQDAAQAAAWKIEAAATQTAQSAFQAMSISQTGIYNYDSIKRLSEPVTASASYRDRSGKEVKPVLIYMQDNDFNGAIKYNGDGGYSPYVFAYSSTADVTIIAFDADANAYACTASEFDLARKKAPGELKLSLRALNELEDMEALRLAIQ